ncbi:MAG: secretin N-terminal domain-containing protein [Candidatus Eisenbacteria bacterium]
MTQGTKRHVGWLAMGAIALALAGSARAWPIESATLEEDGTDLLFSIKAPAAGDNLPYDVFSLENPNRVVVDLFDADAPTALTGETAAQCLANFRTSLWKDDPAGRVVRYVFETATPMSYHAELDHGSLRVRLAPSTAGKSSDSSEPSMESNPATVPSDSKPGQSLSPNPVPLDEAPLLGSVDPRQPVSEATPAIGTPTMAQGAPSDEQTEDAPMLADAIPAMTHGRASAATTGAAARGQAMSAALPAAVLAQTDAAATKAMNLDVQAADLRTVFRSIAEFGGQNIVADRDVEGPVSIRLVQTPWRQALDIVCRSAGLVALDEQEGVIRVATLRSYREEMLDREAAARKREDLMPVVTRVFPVRYASARELKAAVEPALSPRGIAEIDERTNSVIVRDIEARLSDVDALVTSLDAETQQVEIVAQLVDLDATATSQLGIDWSIANLHSTSERVSGAANVSEPLLSPSGSLKLGVVRKWGGVEATLDALERSNRANIISNPKITTTNNRKAKILVGKEIPLITLDERGNPITELKRVGISLEVTPYINSDKRITMDLHPEVSDLSSQATVTGGLIFTTSNADTRVMVMNGETAVIGGLIRTNETKFAQGIPVLRSLPLIGALFQSTDTRKEKRELVILVTPTIVENMANR